MAPDPTPRWHTFPSSEALAETLADDVAAALARGLKASGTAALAVSGGTTPGRFFDALSTHHLDWKNVVVTLVDERFVPPSSDRSNERLVRDHLLVREARLARFVPLFSDAADVGAAARRAEVGLALLGRPLDAVVLGMGTDGHTASFFPDASDLPALLDPQTRRIVMPVEAPSAGEARLTLTLPPIVDARFLALHVEGEEKEAVLKAALGEPDGPPIAAVARHAPHMQIYWSEGAKR